MLRRDHKDGTFIIYCHIKRWINFLWLLEMKFSAPDVVENL